MTSLSHHLSAALVLSVICATATLQAQTETLAYCPMAQEGATWVIYDDGGFYAPVGIPGSYVVRIEGDSLLGGRAYKKMWVANLDAKGASRPSEVIAPYTIDTLRFYGLVRDDTATRRFVGVVPEYDDPANQEEVLINDFGIGIGEPMLGVYKQDTVLLVGITERTVHGKARRA